MESLDLIELKTRAHSSRIALHMASAIPSGLATGAYSKKRVSRIWMVWLTGAALVIMSTMLAIAVAWAMRKAL